MADKTTFEINPEEIVETLAEVRGNSSWVFAEKNDGVYSFETVSPTEVATKEDFSRFWFQLQDGVGKLFGKDNVLVKIDVCIGGENESEFQMTLNEGFSDKFAEAMAEHKEKERPENGDRLTFVIIPIASLSSENYQRFQQEVENVRLGGNSRG